MLIGTLDCQLPWSEDGIYFTRVVLFHVMRIVLLWALHKGLRNKRGGRGLAKADACGREGGVKAECGRPHISFKYGTVQMITLDYGRRGF